EVAVTVNEKNVHDGQDNTEQSSLDLQREMITTLLHDEQEGGHINSLSALQESRERRTRMADNLQHIQAAYYQLSEAINGLPALPSMEQIQWAQAILAMPTLAFWEIDTTGLHQSDEIIRFTLIDWEGKVIDDFLIQPTTCKLSAEASRANGIKPEQLIAGLPLAQAWERIRAALAGRYVISFNQDWDVQKLTQTAVRHALPSVRVIGDCLQRHATQYYHGEYCLTLEELCARVGSPLPAKPHQTSIDRALGQRAVLQAFANAVTDVRLPRAEPATAGDVFQDQRNTDDGVDPYLDDDGAEAS
ncbi:MAG: hypothetical protein ACRDHZ_21115, partial [Ktedonobacteraceae bacterium]